MAIRCDNAKCVNNDGEGWCTEDSILGLSKASANLYHLPERMVECMSFDRKPEEDHNGD